jgi:D-arginine dehydrogenase
MTTYDFAVVGSGIAGASIAARLAAHARVVLLEREPGPGYHSTGRSAALYSALYGNDVITAVTRASRAFFDAPPQGFSDHPLLSPRGVLYAGDDAAAENIEQIGASPLAERITTRRALELVPVLRPQAATQCAYEPGAFDVDVHALHQGFLRMAKSSGVTVVYNAEVRALDAGKLWRIVTAAGDFRAQTIVNAAGAWADTLARLAGAQPCGVQPLRRTAMIIDAPPNSERWPAMIAGDESYYFKPDAGKLLASPADETPSDPCDAQPEELDIAICADRIETHTTLQVKRVVRAWAGLRSFAPDRTPVVGYDAAVEGFFWLAGQGGYGVQTAPALSEIAAALALCKHMPDHIVAEGFVADRVSPRRLHDARAAA